MKQTNEGRVSRHEENPIRRPSQPVQVIEPRGEEEFARYYALRWAILRAPWDQPQGSEQDALEADAHHFMVCSKNNVVGVGRLHVQTPQEAWIRYMAVREDFRKRGIGKALLKALEERAQSLGCTQIHLNARESAIRFYTRNGYRTLAPAHILYGRIVHWHMSKGELRGTREE